MAVAISKAVAKALVAVIRYRVTLRDPAAHLLQVELTLDRSLSTRATLPRTGVTAVSVASTADDMAAPVTLTLPSWIPGSYMIREFARHIVAIEAHCDGRKVALSKIDKDSWQTEPFAGSLVVRYQVYAWDLSVRAAHFDDSHLFFNGCSWASGERSHCRKPCAPGSSAGAFGFLNELAASGPYGPGLPLRGVRLLGTTPPCALFL